LTKKGAARARPEQQIAIEPSSTNELTEPMMTAETVEIDWSTTCEKCLGKMVKRRVIAPEGPKIVMQCVRCRFFHDLK
jgi:hypothetical protein